MHLRWAVSHVMLVYQLSNLRSSFEIDDAIQHRLADSPSAGFFVKLRGRAAQAQRSAALQLQPSVRIVTVLWLTARSAKSSPLRARSSLMCSMTMAADSNGTRCCEPPISTTGIRSLGGASRQCA